jgi:UDP-glucose 4-epimerase
MGQNTLVNGVEPVKAVVTGAAGFIGSHLVDKLLEKGYTVTGIDNFSSGSRENLSRALRDPKFRLVVADLREPMGEWTGELRGASVVFHFAANPEVRHSVREPLDHYHQNVTATLHVLEAARRNGVGVVVFASSSTVYGDPETIPTPEDHPLKPISVYGATKAAAEVFCETYARLYGIKCLILRYANIVGPRLRHGVIYDFIMKLRKDPHRLEILGDGTQRKSYLYISDAIEATMASLEKIHGEEPGTSIVYNVGNEDWVTVREIADIVVKAMGLSGVEYVFRPGTPDGRGWPGDVKLMLLSIKRIKSETNWRPRLSSAEAVEETARQLIEEFHE